ncbi:MAG: hypothetical protein HY805_00745 [Nitrospirae bacterium]|nr:hypothetical protein [Nitrospirota bacterium]
MSDLETIEQTLKSVNRQADPARWSKLMNMKGVALTEKGLYREAESAFISVLYVDDVPLKCKALINFAKTNFLKKDTTKAIELINRVFELVKANKKLPLNLYLGYAHLVKGQISYAMSNEKQAMGDFMKAEFFFESTNDIRGVGLSCLEIARIHIKSKNLTTAWNFLRKAENFLNKLGEEEKLGVAVCKGIALYYSGKEQEAMAFLRDEVYGAREDFGKGLYLIDDILDVYLDMHSRMSQYQQALM